MKYFTMVARSGEPKASAGSYTYTLVADDYSIRTVKGDKLAEAINSGKIQVTNMCVNSTGLVSSNGAISKYTTFDTNGNLLGTPRYVILNRIEVNDKLSGYVAFTDKGIVTKLGVAEAAELAANGLIANGKIRTTTAGNIVASINGVYPLISTNLEDTKPSIPEVRVIFFGSAIQGKRHVYYGGAIITSKNAATITKLFSKLYKDSIVLREKLSTEYGLSDAELDDFSFKQAPGAGFYGVYRIDTLNKLIASGKLKNGTMLIGCTDRNDPDDVCESIVEYNVAKDSLKEIQAGTDKSDKELAAYVKYIKGKFNKE
ncbi:MAG: hypothetical protein IJ593_09425 [Lachnospiraceae bacterium]|nr:hypothetical protein [Lachnospiraceae bacterium]